MTVRQIDYFSVFQSLPIPVLVLNPNFVIVDTNLAYQGVWGKSRDELIGQLVFDAVPANPSEPGLSGPANLGESLRRAVATGEPDAMALQRYDTERIDHPGEFTERYWCPVNVPVHGPQGEITCIIHAVEEVPALIKRFVEAETAGA